MKFFVAGYDVMGRNMAGPGIRSFAIASYLSNLGEVTLSFDSASDMESLKPGFTLISESDVKWDSENYWEKFDAVIMPASQSLKCNLPAKFPVPLIVDFYDPYILENIELLSSKKPSFRDFEYLRHLKAMLEMLLKADRIIVTSERAMDFFLGMMSGWGIINPINSTGTSFLKLFMTIPFGISDEPFSEAVKLTSAKPPAEISERDKLILWAGGLWDWLDPLSLVEAMPEILKKAPYTKLMFMGYKHPNQHVPLMDMAQKCIDRSKQLKLNGFSIIFREWTPFTDRIPLLARADIGVSLHKPHLETRYSFRTRLMDYIWASIPMLLSPGDGLSEEMSRQGVATLCMTNDSSLIADNILKMLSLSQDKSATEAMKTSFELLRLKYSWNSVLEPLWKSVSDISKLPSGYEESFRELLDSFPVPSPPGLIDRGIEKIKKILK